MAITSGSFAKALWPGVNKWYGQAYNEHNVEYSDLFDKNTSRKAWEEDMGTSMFGLAAVKPEGSSILYDTAEQGYLQRYTHVTYGLGFIITREMVDDDLYDVIGKKRSQGLAFSMRQTKEVIAADVYNNAFDVTNYPQNDGNAILDTANPTKNGGTYDNITTGATLSEASLEDLCVLIMGATNDRGLNISLIPQTLIVPTALVFEADRIVNSPLRVGTANNDLNALKNMGKFPGGVKVNHYLTDANAYFIRTNCPDGCKYFERRADDFTMDNDFDTDNAKYKATGRYSFGVTDRRGLYGNAGPS
jgi:hypothetical protein